MRGQHRFFGRRSRQVRSVRRNAAGENELLDAVVGGAIGFGDGFHHPRRSRHIDLPHALSVEHSGAHRIDHKRQVHDGVGMGIAQQFVQRSGGRFLAQIQALKLQLGVGLGRIHIHPNHRKTPQQRQQPGAQVARYTGHDDDRFCHQFGFAAGGCAGGGVCRAKRSARSILPILNSRRGHHAGPGPSRTKVRLVRLDLERTVHLLHQFARPLVLQRAVDFIFRLIEREHVPCCSLCKCSVRPNR